MRHIIALAFADLHLHRFRAFDVRDSRLGWSIKVLDKVSKVAQALKVPVLYAGDWYHDPKQVDNKTIGKSMEAFDEFFNRRKVRLIAISGNHDFSEQNSLGNRSPSHLKAYSLFQYFVWIDRDFWGNKDFIVSGIPYMNNDKHVHELILRPNWQIPKVQKNQLEILMLHSDIPGAMTPEGFQIKETEYIGKGGLYKYFAKWNLVLCGHIHRPQRICDKVFMLGSPIHQNMSDIGIKMGYWQIWNDGAMEFVELEDFPKFRLGKPKNNSIDYWVENEVKELEDEIVMGEFDVDRIRPKEIAEKYLEIKGIKSKAKRKALIKILNEGL